jgi:sensor histidine kinase regulating citrate/malate metabolism
MKLRAKVACLVSLDTFVALALVMVASAALIARDVDDETGQRALAVARTVASDPAVVRALQGPDEGGVIQRLAERVRLATEAEFVVVGDLDLIRRSHPNPAEIGRRMVGEDNADVLAGRESVTHARGTLGPSVRGKAPVFGEGGRQVGVVSVGFLVQGVRAHALHLLLPLSVAAALALALGLVGSWLLSGHVKKQMLGMEPLEIAFATRQQAAILEAIREGVIAIDANDRIVSCNREAKKVLMMEDQDLVGRDVRSVFPSTRLPEVLRNGEAQYDQPALIGNSLVVANRVPVTLGGRIIGVVATFREKLDLDNLESRLAPIDRYVDELRSQRHEFMNKLHLVLGLLHVGDTDGAKEVIEQVSEEHRRAVQFYLARLHDPAVVGILVGKTHRAGELGIELTVSEDSFVSGACPHREAVVTMLGNTIENAFEALRARRDGKAAIVVRLKEAEGALLIEVEDNGPGIPPETQARLFEQGTTTKGQGRGLGLALVSRLVAAAGGTVACESDAQGTVLRAMLPREVA